MATLGSTYLDLIDFQRASPDGQQIAEVIEVLHNLSPIMQDAVAVEANMGSLHRHMIRTGLPTSAWGRLYKGIPQSKSTYQQVDDTTGFREARSGLDTRLIELQPTKAAQLRLMEANGHLEGMTQDMESSFFYEDTATNPDGFKGIASRYNVIGGGGAGNQVVDAGGAGSDNTSIWGITWGESYTHLIYPSGSKAGVDRQDKGEQRVQDALGNPYYVQEEIFRWHMGVAVNDWRYNFRIANIDVSDLKAGTVPIYNHLRAAYYKLQSRRNRQGGGASNVAPVRQALYMNRDAIAALDAIATNQGSTDNFVRLTRMEVEGKEVMSYRGIPIRETDALLNTEARVVAA